MPPPTWMECGLVNANAWNARPTRTLNCPQLNAKNMSEASAIINKAKDMLRMGTVRGPGWAVRRTTTTKNSLGSPWPHCLFMSEMLLPTVCLPLLASATAHLLDVSLSHYVISLHLTLLRTPLPHPIVITSTIRVCWYQQCIMPTLLAWGCFCYKSYLVQLVSILTTLSFFFLYSFPLCLIFYCVIIAAWVWPILMLGN